MSEDNNQLWTELKKQWAKLKKESGATQQEKDAAKVRINEIQKLLGKPVTDWNAPKEGFKPTADKPIPYDTSSKVVWAKSDINQQTINNYDKIVSTAFLIAAMRHPDMDTNSNIFGTIVSAITGHLISMTS